ncbi:histidinol-phosphate transaminase [Amnibacterium setariae]|uniref:Histidinol-phosphate aminotransferase n=1 Tax=Amnibacterium setariae TaxID=2306585 RepID=A0A3A1U8N1_9MICO|nr:histidinol-phosphate transaminase [Amnibacterium setariae]RIX30599.1 aminotransferase class I/II-fold pyridoxal phosphate-dependent enzyme [Amnibacterium setariae]
MADSPVRMRPEIAALPAYKQGRQAVADGYKLSSNENPFGPLAEIVEAVGRAEVNRYPDASGPALREQLGARFGVSAQEVHLGAGSVALLSQFLLAVCEPGSEVVYAWRSFEAYPGLVTVAGGTSVQVPLDAEARHDLDAMADAITDRTRAVIVCTPNNPTGPIVTAAAFERFMARVPADLLVLLDEAYFEFVRDPEAVDGSTLIGRHPNLVLLRTFSKAWGLAGLRLGYAIGPEHLLDAARAVAVPLSVTGQAQLAGSVALEHEDLLLARVEDIVGTRTRLVDGLRGLGFTVPDAQGNFVWLPLGDRTAAADDVFHEHGVVVRAFPGDGVRISIGEHESVARVLEAAAAL